MRYRSTLKGSVSCQVKKFGYVEEEAGSDELWPDADGPADASDILKSVTTKLQWSLKARDRCNTT